VAAHVRRFDRAMSDEPPGNGEGVLEALCDHLERAHGYVVSDVVPREAYAVVQVHEDIHRRQ
jgi:hypothetical protein